MAVIREEFEKNGRKLIKNYSDKKVYIQNAKGEKYSVAIDPKEYADVRIYTETNEPIPEREKEKKNESAEQAE